MAKAAVYCVHIWTTHGPEVLRCEICKSLWYKFKDPRPPKTVIGFVGDDSADAAQPPPNPTEEL